MNVRWRLGVLALQLTVLFGTTWLVTGKLYSDEIWFFAGLLAVVVNPQLLEPYYSKPVDVVANSIIAFILVLVVDRQVASEGWRILGVCIVVALVQALAALILGAGRPTDKKAQIGNAARLLCQLGTARVIYSSVFWLANVEYAPDLGAPFWTLGVAWVVIMVLGIANWQGVWSSLTGTPMPCQVEEILGPSLLLVSAPDLASPGTHVNLIAPPLSAEGAVITRIRRQSDVWGTIHITDAAQCEALMRGGKLAIRSTGQPSAVVGFADVESTVSSLRFIANRAMSVGHVVEVQGAGLDTGVLYQLYAATVERSSTKGGAHLVVRAHGIQLGSYDAASRRLLTHKWVPSPGAPVVDASSKAPPAAETPQGCVSIGDIIGTSIPIYFDRVAASEGHVTILGMTKMGKTSLAYRLATRLSADRCVVVLDLTGEYVAKRNLPPYEEANLSKPSLSVLEPQPNQIAPDMALRFLEKVVEVASAEYRSGDAVLPRTILIDEAHQFVPEPAGLGFNAPGRDSSYKFGLLMMQVRKYGISIILVSQRTAVLAKSALSQCENLIVFRNVDQTGLDYIEAVAGTGSRRLVPSLGQGEALLHGSAISSDVPVAVAVSL